MSSSPPRVSACADLFLRYFTDDVPSLVDAVQGVLDRARRDEIVIALPVTVVAELVLTLENHYGVGRSDVREMVLDLLAVPGVEAEHRDLLIHALGTYNEGGLGFFDAYHAAWAAHHRITLTYTFDETGLAAVPGLVVASPAGAPAPLQAAP